jgi:hypothetical protein
MVVRSVVSSTKRGMMLVHVIGRDAVFFGVVLHFLVRAGLGQHCAALTAPYKVKHNLKEPSDIRQWMSGALQAKGRTKTYSDGGQNEEADQHSASH